MKNPIGGTLKWLFVDLAMRKRLFVTVGAVIVLQLIPLPGIYIPALQEFFHRISRDKLYVPLDENDKARGLLVD